MKKFLVMLLLCSFLAAGLTGVVGCGDSATKDKDKAGKDKDKDKTKDKDKDKA